MTFFSLFSPELTEPANTEKYTKRQIIEINETSAKSSFWCGVRLTYFFVVFPFIIYWCHPSLNFFKKHSMILMRCFVIRFGIKQVTRTLNIHKHIWIIENCNFHERRCEQKHDQNMKNDEFHIKTKHTFERTTYYVQRTTKSKKKMKMKMEWENNNHPKIPNVNILRQYSCLMRYAVSCDSICFSILCPMYVPMLRSRFHVIWRQKNWKYGESKAFNKPNKIKVRCVSS